MTDWTRSRLVNWLQRNPSVWTGWPTTKPLEGLERHKRLRRLIAHRMPVRLELEEVDQVDAMIQDLRTERRARYRKEVKTVGTEGFWEQIV